MLTFRILHFGKVHLIHGLCLAETDCLLCVYLLCACVFPLPNPQPPLLPTRPARRLCCMAPLSVCVRPTTCCWATSASMGQPTCLQVQCPTHCPSMPGQEHHQAAAGEGWS
jgi:hypothetical protein